jgi:hypothetical protein
MLQYPPAPCDIFKVRVMGARLIQTRCRASPSPSPESYNVRGFGRPSRRQIPHLEFTLNIADNTNLGIHVQAEAHVPEAAIGHAKSEQGKRDERFPKRQASKEQSKTIDLTDAE